MKEAGAGRTDRPPDPRRLDLTERHGIEGTYQRGPDLCTERPLSPRARSEAALSENNPSPGEVWRRLDDVVRRFEEVAKDVREFRSWAERLYVPRGEWVEGRRADQLRTSDIVSDVADLKKKGEDDITWRRQVLLAFSIAAFSALVSVAIAAATIVFKG